MAEKKKMAYFAEELFRPALPPSPHAASTAE